MLYCCVSGWEAGAQSFPSFNSFISYYPFRVACVHGWRWSLTCHHVTLILVCICSSIPLPWVKQQHKYKKNHKICYLCQSTWNTSLWRSSFQEADRLLVQLLHSNITNTFIIKLFYSKNCFNIFHLTYAGRNMSVYNAYKVSSNEIFTNVGWIMIMMKYKPV